MELDPTTLYRAVESRDRRFEGRFVLGVTTTGVYCRPGCPARLPRPENVRFFASGASAEDAGFRACRRCRPEAAPGAPARLGTGATVARALRLIDGGGLDREGLDDLAARLGVGGRHLRRLFAEQLGTSPLSIARSRRLHFARKLLDETELPMTEVALSAGFSSTRRFNDEIRQGFGRSPSELRRTRRSKIAGDGSRLALRLAFKPPYDWAELLSFLGDRAIPGVESTAGGVYRRTVTEGGVSGVIEVRPLPRATALELRVPAALSRSLYAIVERLGRVLDLGADPAAVGAHLGRDPRLAPLVAARPGLRVPGAWNGFELAVRAVLGQQISVKGATTLAGRLVEAAGTPLGAGVQGELTHLFPAPAAVTEAAVAAIGLPRARAATIVALAAAVRDGDLPLDGLASPEAIRARLLGLPGIGPWTVEYVAMRALGEPDAFPATDLGLRKATARFGEESKLEALAESWRPFRAYAAMHLWASLHDG